MKAAPALAAVTLGGQELELAWTPLRLPCNSQPCGVEVQSYLLAGITYRPPPGFERHQALIWHWVILVALLLLPIVAVVRIFGGSAREPRLQERALLVAVLCVSLSAIALGVALLALAERRPILDLEKARAKSARAAIQRSVVEVLYVGTKSLGVMRAEVGGGTLSALREPSSPSVPTFVRQRVPERLV